jgi:predicted nucleotidyltransferase
METTKNKMNPFAEKFFKKLSDYLDTKIYFYGSIQRNDYFPNSSDIDADIFTDNESSIINKLQNFLGVKKY